MSNLNLAKHEAAQNASNLPQDAQKVLATLNEIQDFTEELRERLYKELGAPSVNVQDPSVDHTQSHIR